MPGNCDKGDEEDSTARRRVFTLLTWGQGPRGEVRPNESVSATGSTQRPPARRLEIDDKRSFHPTTRHRGPSAGLLCLTTREPICVCDYERVQK